jgi:ParB-like chromosome segregation protein Spo0J
VPIATLTADPRNARKHSEDNIRRIEQSLTAFGQQRPIVISKDNVVIAGNGTMEAARRLGWTTIGVVISRLSGAEAAAFAVADNRTAETSSWDYEQLAATLREVESQGLTIESTGWKSDEISNFIGVLDWVPPSADSLDDLVITRSKSLKLTSEQWERLVRAIGTSNPEKLAAEVVRRVVDDDHLSRARRTGRDGRTPTSRVFRRREVALPLDPSQLRLFRTLSESLRWK